METKDLMTRDLVYNHRNWICPIVEIHKDSAVVIARHYGEEEFKLDDLRPIPLTPEILERNGFEKDERDESMYYWKRSVIDDCMSYDKETSKVRIFHVSGLAFVEILEYVHELQHALRLCRIEKEIVI